MKIRFCKKQEKVTSYTDLFFKYAIDKFTIDFVKIIDI